MVEPGSCADIQEAFVLLRTFKWKLLIAIIGTLQLLTACGGNDDGNDTQPAAVQNISKQRVIVTTDIGGTDFDDYQSMAHLLLYSDRLQIEGLISSPWGAVRNRLTEIQKVIDQYALDYPNLKTYSADYPTPEYLRSVAKQGGMDAAPPEGFSQPTDASKLIIEAAKRNDSRPLWILVWGGIDDLAQALHDDPSIKSKIRVYYIGGPNKKWATAAYKYIVDNHKDLFIIEDNASYRGWFTGGDQTGDLEGAAFFSKYVKDRGALGKVMYDNGSGQFKMGDTPAVAYVLGPNPEDPRQESKGGGRFVRAWDRPYYVFDNVKPTVADTLETYGMVELIVRPSGTAPAGTTANLVVPASATKNDYFPGFLAADGSWHFRFVSKSSQVWTYKIESTWAPLNDSIGGAFTTVVAAPSKAQQPSDQYPNWWTDDPDPSLSEESVYGPLQGIKTINQWRATYLADFAAMTSRLLGPKK